jgi:hypothetical protein
MDGDGTKLAARLRNSGENELKAWVTSPYLASALLLIPFVVQAHEWLDISYGTHTLLYLTYAEVMAFFFFLLIVYCTKKLQPAFTRRYIAYWRPKLEARFRENLRDRGLLLAVCAKTLEPKLLIALTPAGSPWWKRPVSAGWVKADTRTLKGRLNGLLHYYESCCKVLALEPFPPGFTSRPMIYRVLDWFGGCMWHAVMRISLADALVQDAAPERVQE